MNRPTIVTTVALSILLIPTLAFAATFEERLAELILALQNGHWILAGSVALFTLVELSKKSWMGGLFDRIPERYRAASLVVLSGLGGILASVATGTPWLRALFMGLFVGSGAIMTHQAIWKMIFWNESEGDDDISDVRIY